MKLTRKHRQLIASGCAVILILLGLSQALFNFRIDQQISDDITFVLFVLAGSVLLGGRGKKKKDDEKKENEAGGEIEEKNGPDN